MTIQNCRATAQLSGELQPIDSRATCAHDNLNLGAWRRRQSRATCAHINHAWTCVLQLCHETSTLQMAPRRWSTPTDTPSNRPKHQRNPQRTQVTVRNSTGHEITHVPTMYSTTTTSLYEKSFSSIPETYGSKSTTRESATAPIHHQDTSSDIPGTVEL